MLMYISITYKICFQFFFECAKKFFTKKVLYFSFLFFSFLFFSFLDFSFLDFSFLDFSFLDFSFLDFSFLDFYAVCVAPISLSTAIGLKVRANSSWSV